jgi:Ni,Fe-hydrogenase III large subunit
MKGQAVRGRGQANQARESPWAILSHAIIDNSVPGLPLINKSLNFSYSGHDL